MKKHIVLGSLSFHELRCTPSHLHKSYQKVLNTEVSHFQGASGRHKNGWFSEEVAKAKGSLFVFFIGFIGAG